MLLRSFTRRPFAVASLALLLCLSGSCGVYETPGGARALDLSLLGGAFPPSPTAYALTPTSDVVQPDLLGEELPDWIDLRRDDVVPPIQNQTWNSCVGWSLGYYLMTALEARDHRVKDSTLDMNEPENWFSPDYVYAQRETDPADLEAFCHLEGEPFCSERDGAVGCMRPERALKRLMEQGCARWTALCGESGSGPFRTCGDEDESIGPMSSIAAWELGEPSGYFFRPRCYVRFGSLRDPSIEGGTERQIQSWLYTQGTPIAIVVRAMSGWVTFRGENRSPVDVPFRGRTCGLTEERSVCLDAGGQDLGGYHMMTIIGYDRNFPSPERCPGAAETHRGSFLVANQWGAKWGDRGYMWIPVCELQKIWVAGYGLIRWSWETAMPGEGRACAQDEDGRWIELSCDGDDVPLNLVDEDPTCDGGLDEAFVGVSARELAWDGAVGRSGRQRVGGSHTCSWTDADPCPLEVPPHGGGDDPEAAVVDQADWYVVETTTRDMQVEVRFVGCDEAAGAPTIAIDGGVHVPLHRVLDIKIADGSLRDLTRRESGTGRVTAHLCEPGRYFVKVAPGLRDLYGAVPGQDPQVFYRLRVDLAPVAGACEELEPAEASLPEAFLRETFTGQSIPAVPVGEPGGRRFHWVNAEVRGHDEGWGGKTRFFCEVRGVTPGARLEFVTSGYDAPNQRAIDSVTVGEDGAAWYQGWSSNQRGAHALLVYVRNLTPQRAVDYELTVSIRPAPGNRVPEPPTGARTPLDRASGVFDPPDDVPQVGDYGGFTLPGPTVDAVRIMRTRWNYLIDGRWNREFLLEFRHACPDPTFTLLDAEGDPAPTGVRLDEAPGTGELPTPGVTRKLLVVPATYSGDIFALVRDANDDPLRDFSIRTVIRSSLRTWPFLHGPEDGELGAWDRNDHPSEAIALSVDEPHEDALGFHERDTGGGEEFPFAWSWDLYDWFTLHNPGAAATWYIEIEKAAGADASIRWWDAERARTAHYLGRDDTARTVAVPMAAGETKLILMFCGVQRPLPYTLTARNTPPPPKPGR